MSAKKRTTKTQLKIYINYFEQYDILRTGKTTPYNINKLNEIWTSLTTELNSCGDGPVRDTEAWKKVFTEWKGQVRKRAREQKELSDLENKFLHLSGIVVIEGIQHIPELGMVPITIDQPEEAERAATTTSTAAVEIEYETVNVEDFDSEPKEKSTMPPKIKLTKKNRRKNRQTSNELLEAYVTGQTEARSGMTEIALALHEIAKSINRLADALATE